MPKAVLVMDMPERCDKCLLLLKIPQKDGLALCLARPTNGQEEYNPKREKSWRPDWCPLRELPEKKESDSFLIEAVENDCFDGTDSDTAYFNGKDAGWNACLDAIAGK